MLKPRVQAPPVKNVTLGQVATLDLETGPRYLILWLIATVTKAKATAYGNLDDALALINLKVNTVSKRQHLAVELNAIQTAWHAGLAAQRFNDLGNDLVTAATPGDANNPYVSTFVIPICLAEPSRDSYTARTAFGWPTSWVKNGQVVKTANIQLELSVPANANVSSVVLRAEQTTDTLTGPFDASGNPIMPITHWYRQPETYAGTSLEIREWPFNGALQQLSIFSPAGDDIVTYIMKGDRKEIINTSKDANDASNLGWGWNSLYGAGTAHMNYLAADLLHIAFDMDDDPTSALVMSNYGVLALDLTLSQAQAANKTLILLSQVYRDALAAS